MKVNRVHTFRGLLASGGQHEIELERRVQNRAFKIRRLKIMSNTPFVPAVEHVAKIYTESQSSINGTVDFSDVDLLAAATVARPEAGVTPSEVAVAGGGQTLSVIIDGGLFSRNIFINGIDLGGGAVALSYLIEVEEVKVTTAALMQIKLKVARKLSLQQD